MVGGVDSPGFLLLFGIPLAAVWAATGFTHVVHLPVEGRVLFWLHPAGTVCSFFSVFFPFWHSLPGRLIPVMFFYVF